MGLDPNRYKNVGHGHVFPRPDGALARCGGPALCPECAADLAYKAQCEDQGKVPIKFMDIQWSPRPIAPPGAPRPPLRDADRYDPSADREHSPVFTPFGDSVPQEVLLPSQKVEGIPPASAVHQAFERTVPDVFPPSPLDAPLTDRQALCPHERFGWQLHPSKFSAMGAWACEMRFWCCQCGLQFQVLGLPDVAPEEEESVPVGLPHVAVQATVARFFLRPFQPESPTPEPGREG